MPHCIVGISANLKLILVTFALSLVVSCGGGGSASGGGTIPTPNEGGQPGDGTSGTVEPAEPFSKTECESYNQYIWDQNRCVLADNTSVVNVAQIQRLPEADRNDLLEWLDKVDKSLDLDEIFPRWNEGSEEFEKDENIGSNSRGIFVDINFLAGQMNNKPYFVLNNNEYVILHSVAPGDLYGSEYSRRRRVVGGVEIAVKEVEIELEMDVATLLVYGEPVYIFKFAQNITLGAHLGKPGVVEKDMEDSSIVEVNVDESENASVDLLFIQPVIYEYAKPDDQARQNIGEALSIENSEVNNLLILGGFSQLAMATARISQDDFSDYFNPQYSKVYGNKQTMYDYFVESTTLGGFSLEMFYQTPDLSSYSFSREVLKQTAGFAYTINSESVNWEKNGSFKPTRVTLEPEFANPIAEPEFDLAEIFLTRNTTIGASADIESDSVREPSYETIMGPLLNLYSVSDISSAILESELASKTFIEKTAPNYTFENRYEGRRQSNGWGWAAVDMYNYLFTGENDGENLDQRLDAYSQVANSVSPEASEFVSRVNADIKALLDPLNDEQRELYFQVLMTTSLAYAYAFEDLDNKSDIVKAIAVADTAFSDGLIDLLERARSITITPGNLAIKDEFAIQRISELETILTNEYKDLVTTHDTIASEFDLPLRRNAFATDPIESLSVESLNDAVATLEGIQSFAREDGEAVGSQFNFDFTIKEIAEKAYLEKWTADTFARMEVVLAYLQPFSSATNKVLWCEDELSITETYRCVKNLSSMDKRLTSNTSEGYLGEYAGAENPFVAQASTLFDITRKFGPIINKTLAAGVRLRIQFSRMLEDGHLLGCPLSEISDTIVDAAAILDVYYQLVEDGVPTFGSEAYYQIRELEAEFENLMAGCQ